MAITTSMIKELRDATGLGIADCKNALQASDGDFDAAIKTLREKGAAVAAKRASKEAKEGVITAILSDDAQSAAMIEVNCETDFVTRNEDFQNFVGELRGEALNFESDAMSAGIAEKIEEKIGSIGEKLQLRRNVKWDVDGTGAIASYIHMGGKVGVLLELGCEKAETIESPVYKELAKDLTLHVAAAAPEYLTRDEVPAETVEAEKDIFRKQLEGKPENIMENILKGKINKYFSTICFVEQGFVKEDKVSITNLVTEKGKELGDTLTVKRYVRYQLGT
ncbi:translation elongation factor Ts [Pontiella sulfatireligans]|uniref:Elongation factor Ts n=1 Tax=Pontiella sulfatireligans TaxID=2750658 RepID=A0A6C2UF31_9BACT|nr:translation elongation factor Ts [Pontiella sulfatireligans]VGO18780.1 Elongation factor Ts [Pontiella sulfatireligans]